MQDVQIRRTKAEAVRMTDHARNRPAAPLRVTETRRDLLRAVEGDGE